MIVYEQLKDKIRSIGNIQDITEFLTAFLQAYEIPKATLVRLSIFEGISADTAIKIGNKMLFSFTKNENLYAYYDYAQKNLIKNQTYRLIMLANERDILAFDSVNGDWLFKSRTELYKDCDFFYPLAGLERNILREQENANIKIGEKFAQLYNELLILNPSSDKQINSFIVDSVFCMLADSFDLIEKGSLYRWITLQSKEDGSDLGEVFDLICESLTGGITNLLENPVDFGRGYLHGNYQSLTFNKSIRKLLVRICEADWSEIEPEVLGALIQAIAFPTESSVSYNYTSTANVYKVIGPLFMDDLYEGFEKAKREGTVSEQLLLHLEKIKVFDPNCGTGNFLMVTLREMLNLEKIIMKEMHRLGMPHSKEEYVHPSQFYGIESKQIAAELTQIGIAFTECKYAGTKRKIGSVRSNIVNRFPLDVDWNEVCAKSDDLFIIGNPVYMGARPLRQNRSLFAAMNRIFYEEIENGMKIGDLDLATAWLYLATKHISGTNGGFAFVTTNSLTQGRHVPDLWPVLFNNGICISFAYTRFKWKNEGRNNTAVTVVILGCRDKNNPHKKTIYDENKVYDADDISPYLHKGKTIVVEERTPICTWMPKMRKGNMAAECAPNGKHTLFLEPREKDDILALYPEAVRFLRRAVGSDEFVKHRERWCLWIDDNELEIAMEIPFIEERVEATKYYRLHSPSSKKLAEKPHQFRERYMPEKYTLVIPAVTGENRGYFQIGYVGKNVVVTNLAFAIYDAEPWVFGLLSSKMHHIWACTVCGGLETRPRYSNVLGYNTFPIPKLTDEQKQSISDASMNVIMERENYSEMTLVELYNFDTMPDSLKYAHKILDETVEQCYGKFYSDQERLDAMFQLYEKIKEARN